MRTAVYRRCVRASFRRHRVLETPDKLSAMKTKRRQFGWIMSSVAIVACGVFFVSRSQRAPSESEMRANFRRDKTLLTQFVRMARNDKLRWTNGERSDCLGDIDYYDKKSGATCYKARHDLSEERQGKYRAIMRQAGVHNVVYSSDEGICRFSVFGGGFTDTSWSIGYAWAEKPSIPLKIVPSAYYYRGQMRGTIVYSRLEKDWFIYRSR